MESFRDAVRDVAERLKLKRSRVYDLGLALGRASAKNEARRVRAYRSGLFAESVAALLLRLKGHRIVARRYKTPVGEIDLVALKGKRLAFVEVKRRKSSRTRPGRCPPSSGGASCARRNIGSPAIPVSPAMSLPSTWCSRRHGPGRAISQNAFPV